jgi:hypothetical protein
MTADRLIRQTRVSLFLMSFTFLAIWFEIFICLFITRHIPYRDFINLLILYLFSLFLPAIGLLIFMKNTRRTSSRWYWGIPLLIGLILNTFLRDAMFMIPFNLNADQPIYGQPFIASFFPIFQNSTVVFLISIFFSAATALFCLYVPKEKRKKFMLPLALSIIAVLSNFIQFIVTRQPYSPSNETMSYYSFVIFSISILFLGLSFIVIADVF